MKKTTALIFTLIFLGALFAACDQQKAVDHILQTPEMKSYLMEKMADDEEIKAVMLDKLLADTAWVNTIMDRISETSHNREQMFDKLLAYEGMGEIMLEKMADNPDLKKKMKELGKRR